MIDPGYAFLLVTLGVSLLILLKAPLSATTRAVLWVAFVVYLAGFAVVALGTAYPFIAATFISLGWWNLLGIPAIVIGVVLSAPALTATHDPTKDSARDH